jgi:hypothetical protein
MMKRLLLCLLAIGLSVHLTGCSSGGSKDDLDGGGDVPIEGSIDDPPLDESAVAGSEELPLDGGGATGDLDLPPDGGQAVTEGGAPPGDLDLEPKPDVAGGAPSPDGLPPVAATDPLAPSPDAPPSPDGLPSPDIGAAPPSPDGAPTDKQVFNDLPPAPPEAPGGDVPPAPDSGGTDAPVAMGGGGDSPDPAPRKPRGGGGSGTAAKPEKVKDAAFTAADGTTNLNRVYIARKGDTLKKVSEKLYNEDKTKDLKSWNKALKNRQVKVGDQIYYTSAKDPSDSRMMNYYEELGLPPATYRTKEGDNLRSLARTMLDSGDSYKELYATNPEIDSTGKLPPDIDIKYWKEDPAALAANNAPPALPPVNNGAPPPNPMDTMPPIDNPAQPPIAMNDPSQMPPPPPPPPDMNQGQPPPPPIGSTEPPPPPPPSDPPPPPDKKPRAAVASAEGGDPDTMMAMGFGGILILAAAFLYIVIRKNRAKRVDLGQTQV